MIDVESSVGGDRVFRGGVVCDFWQYHPKKKYNTDGGIQEDGIQ
jgi:hypothetical protein